MSETSLYASHLQSASTLENPTSATPLRVTEHQSEASGLAAGRVMASSSESSSSRPPFRVVVKSLWSSPLSPSLSHLAARRLWIYTSDLSSITAGVEDSLGLFAPILFSHIFHYLGALRGQRHQPSLPAGPPGGIGTGGCNVRPISCGLGIPVCPGFPVS